MFLNYYAINTKLRVLIEYGCHWYSATTGPQLVVLPYNSKTIYSNIMDTLFFFTTVYIGR